MNGRAARALRLLALPAFLGWPPPAGADTVLLKNGNRIQGEIIEEGPQGLTLKFFGGTLFLKSRDILSVERESRLQYLLEQGEAFSRQGDGDQAVEAFRKALSADADSEPARRGLAAALERRAEELAANRLYRRSIAAWHEVLAEQPAHPRARGAIERLEATCQEGAAEESAAAQALMSGRVDQAADLLRALYRKFPERQAEVGPVLARALTQKGHLLLAEKRCDLAEEAYLEALSLEPDLLPAIAVRFSWARAFQLQPLIERGDFANLLAGAESGLEVAPGSEVLSYLAGIAQEGLGRRREAAESFRIAAGYPAGTSRSLEFLRKAADEKFSDSEAPSGRPEPTRDRVLPGNFREIETEHFVVSHRNDAVGAEIAEAAEAAYRRIKKELALKGEWKRRCSIIIYPSKEEFMRLQNHAHWTGGFYEPRAHQISCYQTDPRLASATIPHETGHAMLYLALESSTVRIPLWFNEGFAMHWEPQFSHRYHGRVLEQALRNGAIIRFPALVAMTAYPSDEGTAQVFYAESHFLVELLYEEKGLGALVAFARALCEEPGAVDDLLTRHYRIKGVRGLENRLSGKF